jgi:hypothetical protein
MMIGAAVPVAAGVLAIGHARIDGGTFDFGQPRQVSGTIAARPYPAIRLDHAGGDVDGWRPGAWALLVAPGKHGADTLVAGFDGAHVTLEGTRIQRGDRLIFEVSPGSIARDGRAASASTASTANAAGTANTPDTAQAANDATDIAGVAGMGVGIVGAFEEGATVTLRGEIVDSKCHLGVMVPGEGKTHKDCASLCLRGGIPPALLVRDREGRSALLLLLTPAGDPVGPEALLRLAGEPVEVTGAIVRAVTPRAASPAGWPALRTDPSTWRPLAPER